MLEMWDNVLGFFLIYLFFAKLVLLFLTCSLILVLYIYILTISTIESWKPYIFVVMLVVVVDGLVFCDHRGVFIYFNPLSWSQERDQGLVSLFLIMCQSTKPNA